MAFKLTNPPYKSDITPVYQRDLGPGVLGESLKNQVIILNDKLDPKFHKEVEGHESVHVAQMKSGELLGTTQVLSVNSNREFPLQKPHRMGHASHLENAVERDDHLERALHANGDEKVRTDSPRPQEVGKPVGALVELGVREGVRIEG